MSEERNPQQQYEQHQLYESESDHSQSHEPVEPVEYVSHTNAQLYEQAEEHREEAQQREKESRVQIQSHNEGHQHDDIYQREDYETCLQSPSNEPDETSQNHHHDHLKTLSPVRLNPLTLQSSQQQFPDTRVAHSQNESSTHGRSQANGKIRISGVPGLVLDEITEYAMAREGIDIEDLMPKAFEDFLRECNGNQKLAQMRYDYKEAERQSLIQDIEHRKRELQMELTQQYQINASHNYYRIQQPSAQMSPNNIPQFYATQQLSPQFYATQQPSMMTSKLSRMSHSQAQFQTPQFHSLKSIGSRSSSKKQIDNKIFENMLRNQVEQEVKLRQIQERQELFLMKSNQLQEKRHREIMKKQILMHQKQLQKEEKLRKQEELQRKWQQDTITKLKIKSEITEQRQEKFKHDLKLKMQEKEQKKEQKRHYAQEIYSHYLEHMNDKQKEVAQKSQQFQKKIEDKQRKQKDVIVQKKLKKEQILKSVQEQRDIEEQKKMERFMQAQMIEIERERWVEEQKRKQQEQRQRQGRDKTEKLLYKVEDAYKKMAEWQAELERREKAAADNLKKQQKILAEQLQIKREMKRLKQESAHLKQKRKEAKQKLRNDEQLLKLQNMFEKMDKFQREKDEMKMKKQMEIFKAEQKRADMKTAFYHMSVWNVNEAGDIIKEILEENDKGIGGVKSKSVAEKVREKAAKIRREERLGLSKISPQGNEGTLNFIEEEDHQEFEHINNNNNRSSSQQRAPNGKHDFYRALSHEFQERHDGQNHGQNLVTQKVFFDQKQQL